MTGKQTMNQNYLKYIIGVQLYFIIVCVASMSVPFPVNLLDVPPSTLKIQRQLTMKKSILKYSLKRSIPGIYFIHMQSICIVLLCNIRSDWQVLKYLGYYIITQIFQYLPITSSASLYTRALMIKTNPDLKLDTNRMIFV